MGKNGNNTKIKKLIDLAKSVAIFFFLGRAAVGVLCNMHESKKRKEERQLSRESEISKFKEALKERRVRGIVFRVIFRNDFSSSLVMKNPFFFAVSFSILWENILK